MVTNLEEPSTKTLFGVLIGLTLVAVALFVLFSYMFVRRRAVRQRERLRLERQIRALRQRREMLLAREKHHGLGEAQLNGIPRRIVDVDSSPRDADEKYESSLTCGICLDDYKKGDVVVELACAHVFHDTCVVPWLRTCDKCPFCNQAVGATKASKDMDGHDERIEVCVA
ncbi:hypothetical protein GQ54DRAFT_181589 [Martensiomyces pterosporus]|nr:hypothetical protein GQ54DRAFT_181589 [Martensiomyces pterosporus]